MRVNRETSFVALLAALCLAAGSLAACGGDDDDESPAESSGSQQQSAKTAPPSTDDPPGDNLLLGGSTYAGEPTEDPPVKVAVIADEAGAVGTFGPNQIQATQLMAKLANENGGIMGHPVEVIVENDQADAAVTTQRMRELMLTEKPNLVFGNVLSNALMAQVPLAQRFEVPVIAGIGGEPDFVGTEASIYQGQTAATAQIDGCGFAKFVGEKHPEWRRIVILASNFVYGDAHAQAFKTCLERFAPDARIVDETKFELGTQNFVPLITAAASRNPDFVMTSAFGTDFVRFWEQYRGAGGEAPVASFMDLGTAEAIGNDIPENMIYGYRATLPTQIPSVGQAWVEAYEDEYGELPTDAAIQQIGAFLAYKAAAEKAESLEAEELMEAFRCLRYFEPRGWISIRTLNGQANVPDYFGALIPDREQGFPVLDPDDSLAVAASDVWRSDSALRRAVPEEAQRESSECE